MLERKTILDDELVALYLYPEIGTIHHVIKRSVENERFRSLMAKAADSFVENGCDKYLSDDRAMMTFSYDDLIWAAENWEKRLMPAGWRHWALIPPKKVLGRVMAKRLAARYVDLGIDVRTFEDDSSALEWLSGIGE